jgi:hypothetical protein
MCYTNHIVYRLGFGAKELDIDSEGRAMRKDLKPFTLLSCVISGTKQTIRPTCNICELKRKRLTHIVNNTRFYLTHLPRRWLHGRVAAQLSLYCLVPSATASHIDRFVLM